MYAYITLLSNERYVPGVRALNKALRNVETKYPFYCALSHSVPKECELLLESDGIKCLHLSCSVLEVQKRGFNPRYEYWENTFDKLKIWELEQFDKLVYLDSDMLILGNLDHLFEKKAFSGVCAGKSIPGHEHYKGINSGLVVIEPDKTVADTLSGMASQIIEERKAKGWPTGDQDILQAYLTNWDQQSELQLDEAYNCFADNLDYYIDQLGYSLSSKASKPIFIVHFIGRTKPWTKHSLMEKCWLLRMFIRNKYYYRAYKAYRQLF